MWLDLIVAKRKSKTVTTLQKVYSIFIAYFVCLFVCLFVYLMFFIYRQHSAVTVLFTTVVERG